MGGPPGGGALSGGGGGGSYSFPFNIPNFTGPGAYTLSPGNVILVNNDGSYTFISAGPPGGNTVSAGEVGSIPFNIPGFTGPGIYALGPGNILQVNGDGTYSFISGGPPASSINSNNAIVSVTGPGIYTLSPGTVISDAPNGSYSFIMGRPSASFTTSNPMTALTTTTPSGYGYVVDGVSYTFPFMVSNFNGPGIYTISPGTVIQVMSNRSYIYIQGGSQTVTSTNMPKTSTVPPGGFAFPSITFPTYSLPTVSLGGGFTIYEYYGPGLYTLSSGNVVSIGFGGSFTFILGNGVNGVKTGSVTALTVTLPTVTLAGGINVSNFRGLGIYTLSPGNVLSIDPTGAVYFIQGGPQSVQRGGFTVPTASASTTFLPSYTFPRVNLPKLSAASVMEYDFASAASAPPPLSSAGFVLPGFSFSAFTRRAESFGFSKSYHAASSTGSIAKESVTPNNKKEHFAKRGLSPEEEQQNNIFKNVSSLF